MDTSSSPARFFIGSSSEGLDVARSLEAELQRAAEVDRWDRDIFEPGGYILDSLLTTARTVDFAVLVATPDDTRVMREKTHSVARDNVILEFGLFVGSLGRERVYLLATDDLELPSDVLGVTRLPYVRQSDGNHRAALTRAVLDLEGRIKALGRVKRRDSIVESGDSSQKVVLEQELALLCDNAVAQGWNIKKNNVTTLRLRSPKGKPYTLSKTTPEATRENLRRFAVELKAAGLRVNNILRRPVAESPL